MTHGTLIWHRCFCSYCSPSPSPSLKHDTSLSLHTFFLSFFLPPKRSIPRSFPSPFLRRILSNLSLSLPFAHRHENEKGRSIGASSLPLLRRDARGGSRARREIITRRKGTFSTDTTHTPMLRAVECILTRCRRIRCDGGWLWEPRLVNERCWIYFISTRYYIFFPNVSDFSLACQRIFYLFLRGENWGEEKRRDGKVPLSREGSRRLELNSFRSVVTIKWRDVQRYANNWGEGEGRLKNKTEIQMEYGISGSRNVTRI